MSSRRPVNVPEPLRLYVIGGIAAGLLVVGLSTAGLIVPAALVAVGSVVAGFVGSVVAAARADRERIEQEMPEHEGWTPKSVVAFKDEATPAPRDPEIVALCAGWDAQLADWRRHADDVVLEVHVAFDDLEMRLGQRARAVTR
jgi:hypothetical protein